MLYFYRSVTHAIYDYDVSIHLENHEICIDTMSVCNPLTNVSLLSLWLGNKPHVSYSNPITILIGHLYVTFQPMYSHCGCEVSFSTNGDLLSMSIMWCMIIVNHFI